MKTLVHLSDLHFGGADNLRIKPLLQAIESINPDKVVISGDFTQTAHDREFAEAKAFMDLLPCPTFTVPGNHDVPLFNLFRRIFFPFAKYLSHISPNLSPYYVDDEIALIGINSARRFSITSGKVRKKQLEEIERMSKDNPKHIVKIAVCHHPFELPKHIKSHHKHTHKVVSKSKMAMKRLSKIGVDIFLSGHLHLHYISHSTDRYKIKNYGALLVQAGSAMSKRVKGRAVSFNVLRIDRSKVEIDHYEGVAENAGYLCTSTQIFNFNDEGGWKKAMA